ncbi:MAG: DUF4271 domain-containing protein [Prevotella sp.]|nr:DUF4271 domain-containing protein [Prevotella sp.]MDD6394056.1 DUF4271 domain-containing protein [Prevotella sp.]
MKEADSIALAHGANYVTRGQLTINHKGLSPYQVVKSLPATATEAQKDSAIQANFNPGRIDYNTRIDTLTSLGMKLVKKEDITKARFREVSPFKGNSYFHPEQKASHVGILGDPVPYALSNDSTISGLILGIFILALLSVSGSLTFIMRQAKNFFYLPRTAANITETTGEIRFQLFLVMQTALLIGIIYYLYSHTIAQLDYVLDSQILVIAIFSLITIGYFVFRGVAYNVVNWVFFTRERTDQWNKTLMFLTSLEGVALFPMVVVQVYFRINMSTTLVYAIAVIVLCKILLFYKAYVIFFRRRPLSLQIFLYFCALEIVPVMALIGAFTLTDSYLTLNI